MRTTTTLALLALVLLSPQAVSAADLTVSVEGIAEYDDNALRLNNDEDDDVLFRLKPKARIHEDRGQDVTYALEYAVPFEFAVDNGDELDDIDHEANGSVNYRVNDRLELYVKDRFRYLRSAIRNVEVSDILAGDGELLINQERDRVTLNTAEAGATLRISPRMASNLQVQHRFFDTERDDRAQNWLLRGSVDLTYDLTPKHQVGIGANVAHQQFDDRDFIPGSTVNTYGGFVSWVYRVTDTLSFSMQVGPSVLDSQQDDPIAAATSPAVPFITLPNGSDVSGLGLFRIDGTTASGLVTDGSIVVSQEPACRQIRGTMTSVFTGVVCPLPGPIDILGTPDPNAGIVIDPLASVAEAAVFNAVQSSVNLSNPLADGESDTQLQIFGTAEIIQHWSENLHSALRYQRDQSGASGLGGAVVRDHVTLSNTWDFAERWQASVRGEWTRRESILDDTASQFIQAGPPNPAIPGFDPALAPAGAVGLVSVIGGDTSRIDTMRYGVAGRVTHRFTRNTSGWVQLTYNEQTSQSDTLGDPSDFSNFIAAVGVRHVFDPIELW